MAIKTSTFGRVELSGKDAARFIQQINEDTPNSLALEAIKRARKVSEKVKTGGNFSFSTLNES